MAFAQSNERHMLASDSDPRLPGTGAGAPSPLRFGAAGHGSGSDRPVRRLIGAPTAPPPPRCAIRPRARAARLSPARREQAGDGLPPLHAAGARNGARRAASVCAAFNLRRLRALGVELA